MAETETFQHYEVLKNPDGTFCELGRGAMGVTYKAFDTSLRSLVALKVVNAAFLDSDVARQRFQREARAAAGLRHPNVAGVFHLGEEGGNYFYAMEFIDGETIEAFVRRRGPLPPALALGFTLQVARALRAAAKVGLVHRDIKPANLMLSREDEDDTDEELHVKVIDFGLAKVLRADGTDGSASITGSAIVGTPHYISPEQLEEKGLDTRSDIYSLGVTLWYMLTGKPPYSGSLMQVMSKHLTDPPPFEKIASQPAAVRELLRHMLEKDPARRPQTPSALRREIEDALRTLGAPVSRGASSAGQPDDPAHASSGDGTDSLLPAVALPAHPPSRGITIETPHRAGTAAPAAADTTPMHVVIRDLPRRDPTAATAHRAPPPRARSANGMLIAGAALLLVASGSFAAWKRMSVPRPAGAASLRPPTDTVRPAATPAATPAVAARPEGTPDHAKQPTTAPAATPAVAATPENTPDQAKSPLKQALAAAKALEIAGAADDALLAYTRALDDFPDSPAARKGVRTAIVTLRATQDLPQDIRQPLTAAEQARFAKVRAAVERAADGGFDPAILYLGDHLILTEPAAAADWYHKGVENGQPEAMHQLGNMYRRGLSTGVEDPNYAHWYQEASDKGFPRAKIYLAECYNQGKGGVRQDHDMAFRLLTEAYQAEPRNPVVLEKLSLAYRMGHGTPVNGPRAFALMSQAAEAGNASAFDNLGTYYMNGTGTPKDPVKAVACYRRGAELKNPPSMCNYALCLQKGLGTAANLPQALSLMRQAVDAGYAPAVGYLGTYYLEGIGLDKPDPGKAAALYRDGAARQDPLCQFRYAGCLETGQGVPADKELAARFYLAAAAEGYGPAQEWVDQHKSARGRR